MPAAIPEKPSLDGLESKWDAFWSAQNTYAFDRTAVRAEVFSIDTPPPTVSGSIHMGTAFGYVQTDTIARFHRMRGQKVFYPMGWDDNGLPTERRVQNYHGVVGNASLPYDPGFTPAYAGNVPDKAPRTEVSRKNFIELCHGLTQEDEKIFEAVFRRLGLSVDWTLTYATIDDRSRSASQRAFLRMLARGEAYRLEAPTMWDVDFQTAVAQAELEDKEMPGAYHRLAFDDIHIETTRPELLAACVALVAHPDDARFKPRFGTTVHTPVFGVEVPIMAHTLADPEKGSGIAMICTFGDIADVTWWRELQLPTRAIVGRDGRILPAPPPGVPASPYDQIAGLTTKQAQAKMVELLRASGQLIGEPRAITHPVKFYEKGDRPLEIVTSRQWYIRTMDRKDALLARGRELNWHPAYMRARFEDWVKNLTGDWCVSRQRFFGVPFPIWYPVGPDGVVDHERPIAAPEPALPLDPTTDTPPGYTEAQRGQPGGFVADPDVMDTWATSSVSPQIAGGWEDDPDLFARVFPMDMRPQGHDIIRTWLFATVVRSHSEHDSLPWTNASLNGWILDPDRKKMAKSKGNVVTPAALLDEHGSDAVRYWAASARPGVDTAFDAGQMKIGRKLSIKILNATKFVLGITGGTVGDLASVSEAVDLALLSRLRELLADATKAFEGYDYARALERTEGFFWFFCDDYVELVKNRAYGALGADAAASAQHTLAIALSVLQRLFAPFLPFVTDEVWSWWREGSIHAQSWPTAAELAVADETPLDVASAVLGAIRRAKTEGKKGMRWPVASVVVNDVPMRIDALALVAGDVRQAGSVGSLTSMESTEPSVVVVLSDEPAPAAASA